MMKSTSMADYASEAARAQALGRVLPLWPSEIADRSRGGQERICRLLGAALRRERQRGVAGHWALDLGRHAALAAALVLERRRLAALRAGSPNAVTITARC
jgi:hypothetical protein